MRLSGHINFYDNYDVLELLTGHIARGTQSTWLHPLHTLSDHKIQSAVNGYVTEFIHILHISPSTDSTHIIRYFRLNNLGYCVLSRRKTTVFMSAVVWGGNNYIMLLSLNIQSIMEWMPIQKQEQWGCMFRKMIREPKVKVPYPSTLIQTFHIWHFSDTQLMIVFSLGG